MTPRECGPPDSSAATCAATSICISATVVARGHSSDGALGRCRQDRRSQSHRNRHTRRCRGADRPRCRARRHRPRQDLRLSPEGRIHPRGLGLRCRRQADDRRGCRSGGTDPADWPIQGAGARRVHGRAVVAPVGSWLRHGVRKHGGRRGHRGRRSVLHGDQCGLVRRHRTVQVARRRRHPADSHVVPRRRNGQPLRSGRSGGGNRGPQSPDGDPAE